ncbi:hypothetical protein IE331_06410 [Nocardioides sp. MJB4]|uniref:Uncharacterized protein n=1 Tax=Nocardioides donggukensis TaxID=2774019 RepID=A0A927K369_9ACTN|nr:hypothetical protein [Nocardioides donggukensis]
MFEWTSPHGLRFRRDRTGTLDITDPTHGPTGSSDLNGVSFDGPTVGAVDDRHAPVAGSPPEH